MDDGWLLIIHQPPTKDHQPGSLPAGCVFRQTLDGAFFLDLDLWSFRSREFASAEAESDLPYRESLAG
jgi:hypothetical protein